MVGRGLKEESSIILSKVLELLSCEISGQGPWWVITGSLYISNYLMIAFAVPIPASLDLLC
jgi:hypothetical protein